MTTSVQAQAPYVVEGTGPASSTAQTRAMERLPGIAPNAGSASKIWLGLITGAPNETGPPHHHGEAETAAYLLSGRVRVYFGEPSRSHRPCRWGSRSFSPAPAATAD